MSPAIKLRIATPVYKGINAKTARALMDIISDCAGRGVAATWDFVEYTNLQYSRAELVGRMLVSEADYLLFIDGDNGVPPDVVQRMIATDLDIVCVAYPIRQQPGGFSIAADAEAPIELANGIPVFPIHSSGFGCCLIKAVRSRTPLRSQPRSVVPLYQFGGPHLFRPIQSCHGRRDIPKRRLVIFRARQSGRHSRLLHARRASLPREHVLQLFGLPPPSHGPRGAAKGGRMKKPSPRPDRCAHCGLPVARWKVKRGKLTYCTWICAQTALGKQQKEGAK